MPYNPYGQRAIELLNELGADPEATKAHPNWRDVQVEHCLDVLPQWFAQLVDASPSNRSHLDDDMPAEVKETMRKLFVRSIENGEPVQFTLAETGEWGAHFDNGVIAVTCPAVPAPA